MNQKSKNPHIYSEIDTLRAVAALLVLIYHVIVISKWENTPDNILFRILHSGWIGVDLFFVISGFVITLSILRSDNIGSKTFYKRFTINRFSRLLPLYIISCIIYTIFIFPEFFTAETKYQLIQILSHITFTHNLHPMTAGAINGPTWSIGLEVQFYLLMMVFSLTLIKSNPWVIFVTLTTISWIYRYTLAKYYLPYHDLNSSIVYIQQQILGSLDAFAVGILIAKLSTIKNNIFFKRNIVNFIAWIVLFSISFTTIWPIFEKNSGYWHSLFMIIPWRGLLAMSFGLLMMAALTTPHEIVRNILKPINSIGKISYGIYLWHIPILLSLSKNPNIKTWDLLILTITLTILMSIISWNFIEKPFLEKYSIK